MFKGTKSKDVRLTQRGPSSRTQSTCEFKVTVLVVQERGLQPRKDTKVGKQSEIWDGVRNEVGAPSPSLYGQISTEVRKQ